MEIRIQHTCLPIIPVEPGFEVHFDYSLIFFPIFVNNNNKYSYYKFINAKFEFSILVYLLYPLNLASGFGSFWIFIDLFTYFCKLYQRPFSFTKLCLNLCAVVPDAIITSISDPNL